MTTECNHSEHEHYRTKVVHDAGASGAVYGLGMIGAWIFFIGQATTFWMGVLGFLKGIVWPVFMVLEMFRFLGLQ